MKIKEIASYKFGNYTLILHWFDIKKMSYNVIKNIFNTVSVENIIIGEGLSSFLFVCFCVQAYSNLKIKKFRMYSSFFRQIYLLFFFLNLIYGRLFLIQDILAFWSFLLDSLCFSYLILLGVCLWRAEILDKMEPFLGANCLVIVMV